MKKRWNSKIQLRTQIEKGHTGVVIAVSPAIRSLGSSVEDNMLELLDEWAEEHFVPTTVYTTKYSGEVSTRFAQTYCDLIGAERKGFEVKTTLSRPYYHFKIPIPQVRHMILFYVEDSEDIVAHNFSRAVIKSTNCPCGECPKAEWFVHGFGLKIH